ncbi:MAG TPA: sulfatase-like hydrolase/transferase [Agriterribacter sp.]|nr:sulfatase-like hydrolase/transferase [Agriterribacter sp.]
MLIKIFVALACNFLLHTALAQHKDGNSQTKPNIILLLTDDQTYTAIHALGNTEIITPNMDRLVRMGTSFTNAHNMGAWGGAVCVASRAMLISGRTVWHAKQITKSWQKGDSTDKTWGKLMEQGGYNTYMTGKWHVDAAPGKVFQVAKDVRPGMPGDHWNLLKMEKPTEEQIKNGDTKVKYIMPVGYNRPLHENDDSWTPYDTTMGGYWKGGKHWSLVLRDDAIGFIETVAKKEDPFFMYIASNAPHDPRQSPKEYLDKYPLENISLPKSWLPEYPYKDAIDNGPALRDEALAPFPRTEYAIKTHIREYYASITYLDEQIGDILDALEKSGKMDNTFIFFTSDHGLAIGRHGLLGKQSLFEHSVKPPLIIAGPGIPKNKIIDAPVYMQDIMATSLEVAGIPKPGYAEFHSLMDLAKGKTTQSSYPAIYGSYMNVERSIYTGDYKLILYPNIKKTLLFNLKNDPEEMYDLAGNPAYRKKVASLFLELINLQKSLDDTLDLNAWYKELTTQ